MYKRFALLAFLFLTHTGFSQDSLFTTISGDTLTIHHQQTERNCAALFTYEVEMLANLITVTEVDTGDQVWCMCHFDLEVSLIGLDPGTYQIDVWSNDLGSEPIFHGSLSVNLGGLELTRQVASDCLTTRDDTSFIELSISGDTLALFWDTPLLNCALEPAWSGWLTEDTFHVAMQDTGMPADCICPFELSASFASFGPGTYTLDFWNGEYGYPQFNISGLRDGFAIVNSYQSPCYDPTSISWDESDGLPQSSRMDVTCYPNPFNHQVSISLTTSNNEDLEVLIYDIKGNLISTLMPRSRVEAGEFELTWKGVNEQNMPSSSGVYLLVLRGNYATRASRLVLLK